MVSLTIFAMAAVVLGAAYVNILTSYDVVSRSMVTDEDVAFARAQVLAEPDRTKLEKGGEFETVGGRRASWSVEITSTHLPDLYSVAFSCQISEVNVLATDKTEQTFVVLRPTWTVDPGERDKLKQELKLRIQELQVKDAL